MADALGLSSGSVDGQKSDGVRPLKPGSWHAYPSIFSMGHRALAELLSGPVYVEEKVDGSQFSFAVNEHGEVLARSKGATLHVDAPEKMFSKAIETVQAIASVLHPGWTYRAEYLAKPKHNTLSYSRIPERCVIVFDINTGEECYLPYEEKRAEAERVGLECVPLLYKGMIPSVDFFRGFLDRDSVLGGTKIEGVVVKPVGYGLYGADKKALIGKFVSEQFKEQNQGNWKVDNQGPREITEKIAETVATPARWTKAVQHLRELGQIQDSPKDIGKCLAMIQHDVEKECREDIAQMLWDWAWPQIRRKSSYGFPEWYKDQLLAQQFQSANAVKSQPVENPEGSANT